MFFFIISVFTSDSRHSAQRNLQCHTQQPDNTKNSRQPAYQRTTSLPSGYLNEWMMVPFNFLFRALQGPRTITSHPDNDTSITENVAPKYDLVYVCNGCTCRTSRPVLIVHYVIVISIQLQYLEN